MFKLMSKEIVPTNVERRILSMEGRGTATLRSFVDDRICGDTNLWKKCASRNILHGVLLAKVSHLLQNQMSLQFGQQQI